MSWISREMKRVLGQVESEDRSARRRARKVLMGTASSLYWVAEVVRWKDEQAKIEQRKAFQAMYGQKGES